MRALLIASLLAADVSAQSPATLVYSGHDGIGKGAHIVFVTGEEEYRSEEGMPQLARILAFHQGFHCTVLFAIDPKTGAIDPGVVNNIPGLEALDSAALMLVFTRFRNLPDEQMQHFVDYVQSGRPIVGLRTATHAFDAGEYKKFEQYGWRSETWDGGFGRQVLGETWVAHHGGHGSQSTRGIVATGSAEHPILRGFKPGGVWDPADVYTVRLPLPSGCTPILLGQVLAGMQVDAKPAPGVKDEKGSVTDLNDPMMPLAWTHDWKTASGKSARVFTTTMGSAQAFTQEGSRRLIVNACVWALGMEKSIAGDLDVSIVGEFAPGEFGFGKHKKGVKPADLAWPAAVPAKAAGK